MASWCGNGCCVDMEYLGNGAWEYSKCGKVIEFEEPDDDSEKLSAYGIALIWKSNGNDEEYISGYGVYIRL